MFLVMEKCHQISIILPSVPLPMIQDIRLFYVKIKSSVSVVGNRLSRLFMKYSNFRVANKSILPVAGILCDRLMKLTHAIKHCPMKGIFQYISSSTPYTSNKNNDNTLLWQ